MDDSQSGFRQVTKLNNWLRDWNQTYARYVGKDKKAAPRDITWRDNLPDMLSKLAKILDIPKIEAHLDAVNHLILIPHRDLHRFPLHTFFENLPCHYLPSAQLGIERLQHNRRQTLNRLLMVENPKSTTSEGESIKKLAELPFAEVEAAWIRGLFQRTQPNSSPQNFSLDEYQGNHDELLLQPQEVEDKFHFIQELFEHAQTHSSPQILTLEEYQVSRDELLSQLQESRDVFHFTGHGAYDSNRPAQSCLFLSGSETLTLQDIIQVDDLCSYQLVCLAACETAVTGNQTITDEYVGLTGAFLRAGVRSVISTLWRIESAASMLFVTYFYKILLAGQPPATALKAAQTFLKTASYTQLLEFIEEGRQLIQNGEHPNATALNLMLEDQIELLRSNQQQACTMGKSEYPYGDPYYWAAFSLSGL
jgi:CHAT domain-containing protein